MIEEIEIEKLELLEDNPRQIKTGAISRLAKSLAGPRGRTLFQKRPCLVNNKSGKLIVYAGNQRLRAAKTLGWKKVPCIVETLTKAQEREETIKDNLVIGNWDDDLLANQFDLKELEDWGMDLKALGIEPFGNEETNEIPKPPKEPRAKRGEVYILGKHRLMCGDSTNGEDVSILMNGKKALLVATDPPYLVDYTGNDRPGESGKDWSKTYKEIDIHDAESFFDHAVDHAVDHAAFYFWHAHRRASLIEKIFEKHGILIHQQIIWVKPSALYGFSFFPWQHEPCFFGWKKGFKPKHDGDNSHSVTSVWSLDWEGKSKIIGNQHPTQKPLEIFGIPIRKHTVENDIIYEPFCGSGSQLISAEIHKRCCFAMEISPVFVDVIIKRYCNFTGANEDEIYNSAMQMVQEGVKVA